MAGRYGVESGHPDTRGSVDYCLIGRLNVLFQFVHESRYRIAYVDGIAPDTESVNKQVTVGYISLFALRHENADNSVPAESLCTYCCGYGAVLSSRYAYYGIRCR